MSTGAAYTRPSTPGLPVDSGVGRPPSPLLAKRRGGPRGKASQDRERFSGINFHRGFDDAHENTRVRTKNDVVVKAARRCEGRGTGTRPPLVDDYTAVENGVFQAFTV